MKLNLGVLALIASTSVLDSARAFVPWSNPNGVATTFDWFGGGSDFGLFGSPVLVGGDTFIFFPNDFRAQSSDGHTAGTHDRLQVEILAHQGQRVTQVSFINTWTYNVVGEGSSVAASSTIFLTDLNNFRTLSVTYTLPPGLTGSGELLAGPALTLPIDDTSWNHFQLVVRQDFFATSAPGGAASIRMSGQYSLQVPIPGAVTLLGVAGLVTLGRRR